MAVARSAEASDSLSFSDLWDYRGRRRQRGRRRSAKVAHAHRSLSILAGCRQGLAREGANLSRRQSVFARREGAVWNGLRLHRSDLNGPCHRDSRPRDDQQAVPDDVGVVGHRNGGLTELRPDWKIASWQPLSRRRRKAGRHGFGRHPDVVGRDKHDKDRDRDAQGAGVGSRSSAGAGGKGANPSSSSPSIGSGGSASSSRSNGNSHAFTAIRTSATGAVRKTARLPAPLSRNPAAASPHTTIASAAADGGKSHALERRPRTMAAHSGHINEP